jgi:hypothetical protein
LLQFWRAVVEEEGKFEAGGGQVVDGLRPVNIAQFGDGLDFQDDFTVYSYNSMLIEYSKNQSPASVYNQQYD